MKTTQTRFTLGLLWAIAMTVSGGRYAVAQFILGTPIKLGPPIETSTWELASELSPDGLSIYFCRSTSAVGRGTSDIYVATRQSVDAAWDVPQPISPINTPGRDEYAPSLSPDGRELYLSDNWRAGDLWSSSWNEENGAWDEPQKLAEPVNTRFGEWAAQFSADGRELYFSSNRPGGAGEADIWVARRPTVNDPWGEPANLSQLNSNGNEEMPTISTDGRLLFFAAGPVGHSGAQLHVSMRDSLDDDWGAPIDLGSGINTSRWNTNPEISHEGSILYFDRYDGVLDLWQVPLLPLERISLAGGGASYLQDFDQSLTTDATQGRTCLSG